MAVSARQFEHARAVLPDDVRVVEMTTDDSWMRDTGPTFVVDGHGERRAVDWHFDAWGGLEGGLYFPWDQDDLVAAKVAESRASTATAHRWSSRGLDPRRRRGTCLVTEECLLNHNRNPELSREEIEGHLRDYLAVETVIWLGRGIYLDETDGHVDNIACFLRPGVVALTVCDDPADPQHGISQDARARLDAATDARGAHWRSSSCRCRGRS
jgi:agmatine deiminase